MKNKNIITNLKDNVNIDNNIEKYDFNPLEVEPENIPDELKQHPYWCAWKLRPNKEDPSKKPSKIPINPNTGKGLDSTKPETWVTFDIALKAYQANMKYAGVGILLTDDDIFVGIDIDDCMAENAANGKIADDIMDTLNSYTEVSPSGNGLRIICKRGRKPLQLGANKNDGLGFEMYSEKRFLTITGAITGDEPIEIRRCPYNLREINKKYIVNWKKLAQPKKNITSNSSANRFGDTTPSGHDFALCCKWAKAGHSEEGIKRLLLSKGANHKKYERSDYVDRTVRAAIEKVTGTQGTGIAVAKTTNKAVLESSASLDDWSLMPRVDHAAVAKGNVPEPEWLIKDWIRHDTYVAQLVGEQQTGKSYFLTTICYHLACGRSFGPFEIPKAKRISYVNVEDPWDQIDYRCQQVMKTMGFTPEEIALIEKNLLILPWIGRFGTINQPNTESREIILLNNMITDFKPDLVIGDTKSRLSYGDENSNNIQAELVRVLERLAVQYGGPFIMAHHPTKSNPHSSRGAGSWESNVRLTIKLVKMDARTGQKFGFTSEEANERAFIVSSSDNYGGKNIAYFYKNPDTGVPHPIMPENNSSERVQEWLLENMKEHGPVNKRALLQTRAGDDGAVAAMLESFPAIRGDKKEAIKGAVNALIEDDKLYELKEGRTVILTAKRPAPQLPSPAKKKKKRKGKRDKKQ